MKRILRHYIIVTYSLWVTAKLAQGMIFDKGLATLLITGIVFMAASLLAKPVINVLLLPLNLVTFGLFRWVSSAIVLYIVTLIVPHFRLAGFHFAGHSSKWIELPAVNFDGILAFVGFAFVISTITSIIFWIVK